MLSILNCWMLLVYQLLLTNNYVRFICLINDKMLIKEGSLDLATFNLKESKKLRTMRCGELFDHFFNIFFKMYTATYWCSAKFKPTPAQCFLENYLQHPKKGYFSDMQNGLVLTFGCIKWHGTRLTTCAKKQKKSVKKLERKYGTNNQCIIDAVQFCDSSIHYFKYFVGKLKLKFWN